MAHGGSLNKDHRLHTWCRDGNYEKIKDFISTCEDLSLRLAYRRGKSGYTPIHEAVNKGHSKVVDLLLHHDGDVNCRANNELTLLHLAATNGHADCVRVLLMHNADISARDENGRTPIQVAELNSKHAIMKILKSAGECMCVCCV